MSVSQEIVSLDGPSGAGKSTIAKLLAKNLSFKYLDTGAMYRSVTLYFIENNININDKAQVLNALDSINIEFDTNNKVYLNNVEVTDKIRESHIVAFVSQVASLDIVRDNMVRLQRMITNNGYYVVDGRDIGSVVLPNAKYKFYIDASVDERAKRRHKELLDKGDNISFEEVRESIRCRDEYDSNRKNSPLMVPDNATIIDTTNMTIDEVVKKITDVISNIRALYN